MDLNDNNENIYDEILDKLEPASDERPTEDAVADNEYDEILDYVEHTEQNGVSEADLDPEADPEEDKELSELVEDVKADKKIIRTLCVLSFVFLAMFLVVVGVILIRIYGARDDSSYKDFDYTIIQNGEVKYLSMDEPVIKENAYDLMSELDKSTTIVDPIDLQMLSAYKDINPDVLGIIRIDGTVLNHAFCLDDGTDEYIRKDLYGLYNSYGTPYLDSRCEWLKSGRNHVIYGHNIPEGDTDVFAPLSSYESSDYYKKHPIITTVTETGTKQWLIVAYFLIKTDDEDVFRYTDLDYFNSKEGFEEYMSEVEARNWLSFSKCPYEFRDTFLTLSSCSLESWGTGTNRMVVIARLMDINEDVSGYVNSAQHVFTPLLPGEKLEKEENIDE